MTVTEWNRERWVIVIMVAMMACCQGCSETERASPLLPPADHSVASPDPCITVDGIVLGDIIPGSTVSLYAPSSLNFSIVMDTIRTGVPVQSATVNNSEQFVFKCLSPGNHTFAIPTSSYKGAVGSPLPYEFDCNNFSLRIAFQGGGYQYAVGAFSIQRVSAQGNMTYGDDKPRSRLYKDCENR